MFSQYKIDKQYDNRSMKLTVFLFSLSLNQLEIQAGAAVPQFLGPCSGSCFTSHKLICKDTGVYNLWLWFNWRKFNEKGVNLAKSQTLIIYT